MEKFNIGQAVRVNGGKIAHIICKCKEPSDYWSVVVREEEGDDYKLFIEFVDEADIKPYKHECWNCGIKLDSSIHKTCKTCGWVICPECGACTMGECESYGLIIRGVEEKE